MTCDLAHHAWHRAVVAGLATAAISLAILGWVGYWVPIFQQIELGDRLHAYFYTSEGLARFYWVRADDPFYIDTPDNFVRLAFRRTSDNGIANRIVHARPNAIDPMALLGFRRQQEQRRAATPNANPQRANAPPSVVQTYGVRTWISLPIALLAAYPVYVLTRSSRRRFLRKKRRAAGQCEQCGYDLTGLTVPRCPECGECQS